MPRSFGNLWPALVSWENLVRAYARCRRRKRSRPDAIDFDYAWEAKLIRLQTELESSAYHPGSCRHFYIYDPKRRKITAAPFRDRVVHHALVQILEPIFESAFIHDSYACRKKKGTHRALIRAQSYLQKHAFYLKTDIVRFFPNIDHQVLIETVQRRIRDRRVMRLVTTIVSAGEGILDEERSWHYFPGDDLFSVQRPTGLPIGNLTSQFFANVYLDPIDHFIKEELRVPGYTRYADDLVLFANSKDMLREFLGHLRERLGERRLRLHPDKTQILPSDAGLKFLGFKLWPSGRRLQQSTLRRINRRMRHQRWLFSKGELTPVDVRLSLHAWLAHAGHCNSDGVVRELLRRFRLRRNKP